MNPEITSLVSASLRFSSKYISTISSTIMELTLDRRKSLGNKDRICIRLWVFKFVINDDSDDFGVCVEGYRPSDATETILRNWHSTIIKERLTSTLLVSRSGSTYELRGNMDEILATQYGYPTPLIDMFKCGFPPDWEKILREYYKEVRMANAGVTSQTFTVENSPCHSVVPYQSRNSMTVQSTTIKDGKVGRFRGKGISLQNKTNTPDAYGDVSLDSEDRCKSNSVDCVSGKEIVLHSMPESTSVVEVFNDFKIPNFSHLKHSYQQHKNMKGQVISLLDWSIRFVPIGPRIPKLTYPPFVILGRREGSFTQWQTSVIMDVVDGRFCSTISTTYYLEGDMQIMDAAEVGFPKYFVSNFLRGFPPDWKFKLNYLYRTFFGCELPCKTSVKDNLHNFTKIQGDIAANNNQIMDGDLTVNDSRLFELSLKQPNAINISEVRTKFDDKCSFYKEMIECEKSQDREETENRMNHREFPDERRQEPPAKKQKSTLNLLEKPGSMNNCRDVVVRKSSGNYSQQDDIHLSRSGRCVRAPLAQWAGQRVRYDSCGNAIGIQDVNTDTIHCRGAINTLALAEHYGISPPRNKRQLENYSHIPTLAVDNSRKKTTQLNTLVSYSDYSSEDDENDGNFWQTLRNGHYSDSDSPLHKYGTTRMRRIDSENSEEERELRREKRRLKKDARRLAQRERVLIERERKLMESIAKQRKNKQKFINKTREAYQWSDDGNDESENKARDSTNTEVESDGGNWNQHKTSRCRRQTTRKKDVRKTETNTGNEMDKSKNTKANKKEKPWTKGEVNRLKLALAAINVKTDDDWNKISRSLGNQRSAESCMQAAIAKLKWEARIVENDKQNKDICENGTVTARTGTATHRVQANQVTRKFMMGAGSQEDDFFRFNGQDDVDALPDVAEFDANDSLLSAIRTPVVHNNGNKGANRRPFIAEGMEDDTPLRNISCYRPSSPALFDSAQREKQDRYVHHLLQNRSIAPNSTRFENYAFNSTSIRKKNDYENFARQLDDLKNERMRRKRKGCDSDLFSTDSVEEELEDSC